MKQIIQNSLSRIGYQLMRIKPENDYQRYQSLLPNDSIRRKAFYNISAGGHFGFGGGFYHPLWTNIDVSFDGQNPCYNEQKDIRHDFLEKTQLPLESNDAELFLSRFTIEHITDEAALYMLKEVHRCLKQNGVFRIIAPNNELDYSAYQNNDLSFFDWIGWQSEPKTMKKLCYAIPPNATSIHQVFLAHFASNASIIHGDGSENPIVDEEFEEIMKSLAFEDAMNFCTARCSVEKQKLYRQNHINWWTYKKTEKFLREAGFNKVYAMSPTQSISQIMRNNKWFYGLFDQVAFYMEAVK